MIDRIIDVNMFGFWNCHFIRFGFWNEIFGLDLDLKNLSLFIAIHCSTKLKTF